LDRLLKRFFHALIQTVFSDAGGKDGVVILIEAMKVKSCSDEGAGADLAMIEIDRA